MKNSNRNDSHKKNGELEEKLNFINDILECSNHNIVSHYSNTTTHYPIVFIVGVPRSGTSFLFQLLASSKQYAYPTNFVSRFYKVPTIAFEIQELLLNDKYEVKDEFVDIKSLGINFSSTIGKSKGIFGPNEFWYFWRRFFSLDEDYSIQEKIIETDSLVALKNELQTIHNITGKPLLFKGLMFNQYIKEIKQILPNSKFIWIQRDKGDTTKSLLKTRNDYFGTTEKWYSFKLRNCDKNYLELNPNDQVDLQYDEISKSISEDFEHLAIEDKIIIKYDDLVSKPELSLKEIREKLNL